MLSYYNDEYENLTDDRDEYEDEEEEEEEESTEEEEDNRYKNI